MKNKNLTWGLAALKEEDYEEAICQLEMVCDTELYQPTIEEAQLNLVTAYERNGQIEQALELCQTLTDSKNPNYKQWAKSQMPYLATRYTEILEEREKAKRTTTKQKGIHWFIELVKRYPKIILYGYKVKSIGQKVQQRWRPIQEWCDRTGEAIVYKLMDWFPKIAQKIKHIGKK